MIPKKIHYCWLSGDPMPSQIENCILSWKKIMPEYELVLWDKNRFDTSSVQFVAEACAVKKWASASDYIRLYAVYTEGGIYLDSDVMVHKNFSAFLQYDFFTSVEYHKPEVEANNSLALLNSDSCVKSGVKQVPVIALQAAVFGGAAGHPYLRDCMRWYEENSFLLSGYNKDFIAPDVFALTAQKYGFRYKDGKQNLARNMLLLPSCFIAADPSKYTKKAYATHYIAHSWHDRSLTEKIKSTKMYRLLSRNSILRWLIKQSDSL